MTKSNGVKAPKTDAALQKADDRLSRLLTGKETSDIEFVCYMVAKLRETMQAGNAISQRIGNLRAQLRQLEEEALRLEGTATQYARDIRYWDQQAEEVSDASIPAN